VRFRRTFNHFPKCGREIPISRDKATPGREPWQLCASSPGVEIKVSINWLCADGIEVRWATKSATSGPEETLPHVAGIGPWLQQTIAHFYPDSSYARALDPEVRAFASQRLFVPPSVGRRVSCPDRGEP